MSVHQDAVQRTVDVQPVSHAEGHLDPASVHLDAHLLAQVHLEVADLQGYGLGPGRQSCGPCVVGHTDAERVVRTVARQLVLARAAESVELAIECPVVWVAKDRTYAVAFFFVLEVLHFFVN